MTDMTEPAMADPELRAAAANELRLAASRLRALAFGVEKKGDWPDTALEYAQEINEL